MLLDMLTIVRLYGRMQLRREGGSKTSDKKACIEVL
jgi:hypothetical protein